MTKTLNDIHPADWAKVKCKARVKSVVSALEKAGKPIASFYISPAFGSVYIDVGVGAFDAEYECYDSLIAVRVADHERTSGDHAYPDFNIFDAASFDAAMSEIAE